MKPVVIVELLTWLHSIIIIPAGCRADLCHALQLRSASVCLVTPSSLLAASRYFPGPRKMSDLIVIVRTAAYLVLSISFSCYVEMTTDIIAL